MDTFVHARATRIRPICRLRRRSVANGGGGVTIGVVVMANVVVRAQASMTMRNSLALAKLPLAQNRLAEASTVAS